MQRDGSLAGARPALHDRDAAHRGAYDPVLFRLNRGDDIAHLARSGSVQGRDECPIGM